MTGQKNKYTSVEKQWKMDDDTLTTPQHDEMVLWLLNSEHAYPIFRRNYHHELIPVIYHANSDIAKYFEHGIPNLWERLETGNSELTDQDLIELGKVDGYLSSSDKERVSDLWKELCVDFKECMNSRRITVRRKCKSYISVKSEVPILTKRESIMGYWDIVISLRYLKFPNLFFTSKHFSLQLHHPEGLPHYETVDGECWHHKIFVEVKPTIHSFGATLRQLRKYQHYSSDSVGNTYLFTEDLRFRDSFESQGIHVVTREGL